MFQKAVTTAKYNRPPISLTTATKLTVKHISKEEIRVLKEKPQLTSCSNYAVKIATNSSLKIQGTALKMIS